MIHRHQKRYEGGKTYTPDGQSASWTVTCVCGAERRLTLVAGRKITAGSWAGGRPAKKPESIDLSGPRPPRKVVVSLTQAEADALSRAAGNVMNDPDAVAAIFLAPEPTGAAWRAWEKLQKARLEAKAAPG